MDIVAHPTTAKVFMESDFKNGTIWTEGEQTWTGWKHTFPMGVNQTLLEAMYANPIEVRIWDTKVSYYSFIHYLDLTLVLSITFILP